MKFLFIVLLIPLLIIPAFAESQTLPTEKGTLEVKLTYDTIKPNAQTKIGIDFINPQTQKVQEHIDYIVSVSKDDQKVFGPIPLSHTSVGSVKIPIEFNRGEGVYTMDFEVEGILFQPILTEKVSFEIMVKDADAQLTTPDTTNTDDKDDDDSGCLIATAAYGTELAPQVQLLREIRDNTLFSTSSGTAFMSGFNTLYYSFAPTVADWERESPVFKEAVKTMITPMLSTLSIMSLADEGSEAEVLGLGISVILLNLGMYVGVPVFGILKVYQFRRN